MFHGSMVAIVTPMHADGSLDRASLRRLVDFHVENGTTAIVSVGTTGESPTLDTNEHIEVIRLTIEYARRRVPVIAGTGSNSTAEAIDLTRRAREIGAEACLLVTPYYNKPTQEGLFRHYQAIAEAVDLPQILYNVPGRTACDIQPTTVARLANIPNIIGIKEATGNLDRARELLKLCPKGFELYSGDDATGLDFMLLGGLGVISVTTNVAPRAMQDMCDAARRGDEKAARAINDKLMALHRDLFVEANPIPVKWALEEMGLIESGIRLPLTRLSAPHHDTVRAALRTAGLLQ
ncbi:MAG: 4-hydroxy-tetrahydrodipicolinate synthase [Gammaproteobacteria bacterium]|nr:4-hydroxy-tetrahydrodipicolinate synthase [Gammaproteobacteria bacterium]